MNYTSSDSNRSSNVPWRGYFCRLNITIVSILICFKLIVQFAKYIYEECKIWIKRYLLLRRYLVKLLFYLIRRLHKQSQSYLDNVMHTHTPSSPHPFPKKKNPKQMMLIALFLISVFSGILPHFFMHTLVFPLLMRQGKLQVPYCKMLPIQVFCLQYWCVNTRFCHPPSWCLYLGKSF